MPTYRIEQVTTWIVEAASKKRVEEFLDQFTVEGLGPEVDVHEDISAEPTFSAVGTVDIGELKEELEADN